jgi:hypothetical protein
MRHNIITYQNISSYIDKIDKKEKSFLLRQLENIFLKLIEIITIILFNKFHLLLLYFLIFMNNL